MKILVVQDYLRRGGTERQSVLLANAFAAAGHGTTLLTFRPDGPLETTVGPAVGRRALQPFDLRLDWLAPGLFRFVAQSAPDVVLCMGRMANCYGGSIREAAAGRTPRPLVIATMRTGKPLPRLFRRSLHRVDHVVANSVAARDLLVALYGVAATRISVIRNALVFPAGTTTAAPEHDGARTASRTRHHATDRTFVLLNVAMFRPEKNQRELIEIAALLPSGLDWQLWFAGDGPALAACKRRAAELRIADRIRFHGFLDDPSPLYAAADAAVHASTSESLSNFLIEAQAHGLPAVTCEVQGAGECFLPGRTGWAMAPGDRAAFRDRLVALAREPADLRLTRAAEARAFARTAFDPARQAAACLELFARLR